ncbi:hypothetical protein [Bacillus atrophaeus]|uniref:Uncharacterized protein n=1 Tax=Bacillus atrophaeus (strain 1942) TaxID=720555 RepID=A0ABN3ZCH6_BACA1|nr:hypothetical protein [Bacillus atrophaeus]AMR62654.1 hypothetical protein A1D11_09650 [Bacillus subtilis subsp. globigii]ADP32493.1 hypothetical protein BATR1942_07770 [Bacillus atrophaeus 1942]EIM11709.1 hypothetical protein UY9_05592 [Bacillus atrophaeus C89]KFK82042.1 hypothetical protein DK44_2183 [Bacillus atrophaeus]MBG9762137.1 hypothetical protein [Bacillus atrophaeus]
MFLGLSTKEKNELKYEIISHKTRLMFTRLIRGCPDTYTKSDLIKYNRFIDIANNAMGKPPYILVPDDATNDYLDTEYAFHYGEIESIMMRPSTTQFVEILYDFLDQKMIKVDDVNQILKDTGTSFKFEESSNGNCNLIILSVEALDDETKNDHPNIRMLIERLSILHEAEQYSNVLHTCSNIFETLSKVVMDDKGIDKKPFGKYIKDYKKKSNLHEPLLDYIEEVYINRNKEPGAGHGGRGESQFQKKTL